MLLFSLSLSKKDQKEIVISNGDHNIVQPACRGSLLLFQFSQLYLAFFPLRESLRYRCSTAHEWLASAMFADVLEFPTLFFFCRCSYLYSLFLGCIVADVYIHIIVFSGMRTQATIKQNK